MLTSGAVRYEVGGNIDATASAGSLRCTGWSPDWGWSSAIDDGLQLLKVHLPYHESDHVLNLAYNVACGGTRLEDIERLRNDDAYIDALGADLIPDPTTAGDFCRRFTEADVATLMEAINYGAPAAVGGPGPRPARPDRLPRRRRHDRAHQRASTSRAWTSPTRASGATRR